MGQAPVSEDDDAIDGDNGSHGSWVRDGLGLTIELNGLTRKVLLQVNVEVPQRVVDAHGPDLGAVNATQTINL